MLVIAHFSFLTSHFIESIKMLYTKANPDSENPDIDQLLTTANHLQQQGDYAQAEGLYQSVLANDPNNIRAMHSLAVLYMDSNHPNLAIPLLTNTLEIDKHNAYLHYNLGLAYQQCNEIHAAIHYYKNAIEINHAFSQAYNNLGIAYQHLGKLDLANLYLEKAFTIDPHCIEAYYNFAQTHRFTITDNKLIATIKSLIDDPNIQGNPLIKIHFTLGKALDNLGNYEEAFKHYHKANSLKYSGFNLDNMQQYTKQIKSIFNQELIDRLSSRIEFARKRFIFVVGMPRSGTTLVEQIIASHPLVQSGGEIGFIGDIVDDLPSLLDSAETYPQCMKNFNAYQVSQISMKFNTYLDNMTGNFLHITDKSPINFLHIGLIKLLFPESKIVHVSRNPVATCLSCYFQNFERQHQYSYDMQCLAGFYQVYQEIMQYWEEVFGNEIISISYETLVSNPAETMRNLINNCELNWDDACQEFYKGGNIVNSASKWQSRQPIYRDSVDHWRNYEAHIQPFMKLLNN